MITAYELADALGVSPSAIYQAYEAGRLQAARTSPLMFAVGTTLPPAKRRPITARQRKAVAKLRAKHKTYKEIAATVGVSPASVARICQAIDNQRLTKSPAVVKLGVEETNHGDRP